MDAGEIRKQDPALLLFMLYTAVVGSLTEASVLNAVVGEDKGRQSLRMREREVQSFVVAPCTAVEHHSHGLPARSDDPWRYRSGASRWLVRFGG